MRRVDRSFPRQRDDAASRWRELAMPVKKLPRTTAARGGSMGKFKLVLLLVLVGAVILFTLQNTDVVQVHFLLWTLALSQVVLIFALLVGGMALGWLGCSLSRRRATAGTSSESIRGRQDSESKNHPRCLLFFCMPAIFVLFFCF